MTVELINFSHFDPAVPSPWFNFSTSHSTKQVLASGWGIHYTTVPTGSTGTLENTVPTGDAAWADDGSANKVGITGHQVQGATIAIILLSDLDNSRLYSLDFFCNNPSGRFTKIGVNGGDRLSSPTGINTTETVTFTDIAPSSGQITVEIERDGISFASYVSALKLVEQSTVPTITMDQTELTPGTTISGSYVNFLGVPANPSDLSLTDINGNGITVSVAVTDNTGGAGTFTGTMPALPTGGATTAGLLFGIVTIGLADPGV